MIPYKVDVPMDRWPVANFILIGLTVVISFAMFQPLAEWDAAHHILANLPQFAQPISMPEDHTPDILNSFLLQPGNFRLSQLLGSLFIHADLSHLAGNMLFLFVFGNAVNAKLGHLKYISIYLAVGLVESSIWMLVGPKAPTLGASGAIMGIIGAFLILYPLNDVSIAYMFSMFYRGVFQLSAMWVIAFYIGMDVYNLITTGNVGVAYLSHVVGFLTGAAITVVMLRLHIVEMDRGEKSLLQLWGFMPCDDDAPLSHSLLNTIPLSRPIPSAHHRPRPLGWDDDGPIDVL